MNTILTKALSVVLSISMFHASARNDGSIVVADGMTDFQKNFARIMKTHDEMISQVIYFSDHVGNLDRNLNRVQLKKKKLERYIDSELERLQQYKEGQHSQFIDSISHYYSSIKNTVEKEYDEALALREGMRFTHKHVKAFVTALEEADNDIIQIEKALYAIERNYALMYQIEFPKQMEELKSNILKNEKVLRYHDKLLLTFYEIYEKENEMLQNSKNTPDSVLHHQRIALADLMLLSEDTLHKYKAYEGDPSFSSAIMQYFKYLKAQYFEDFEFYNEYIKGLHERGADANYKASFDKAKYEKDVHTAQSQLRAAKGKSKSEYRGTILNMVEDASFRFLYKHSPKF